MPFLIKKASTRWVVLNKNSGKHLAKGEVSKEVLWNLPVFSNQLDSGSQKKGIVPLIQGSACLRFPATISASLEVYESSHKDGGGGKRFSESRVKLIQNTHVYPLHLP